MKTIFFLSFYLAAANYFFTNPAVKKDTVAAYKLTKAKRSLSKPVGTIHIIIDKSDYEMQVFDEQGWYATYPVVFGNNSLADKKMEGDRLTPEGTYKIINKKPHSKWSHFMGIDYPTQEDIQQFNEMKQRGEVPLKAKPGGGIGIHGTWPHDEFMIDRFKNWTNGCIALKNEDVEEVYSYITIGTKVTIKK